MTISPATAKWLKGLGAAVLAAIVAYVAGLNTGCTPAQLKQASDAAQAQAAICAAVAGTTDPAFAKAREACAKGEDVKAALKAVSCPAE